MTLQKKHCTDEQEKSIHQSTLLAVAGHVVPGQTRMTPELLGHPVDPMITENVIALQRGKTGQDSKGS